jgi:16S rRNA processing protein RimM
MININDHLLIGKITKPHGLKGELTFSFTTDAFDSEQVEYLILKVDGILVPFYIDEYRILNDDTALMKFQDVNNETDARLYANTEVYLPLEFVEDTEAAFGLEYFVGFAMVDKENGSIGVITDVDISTENYLFVVDRGADDDLLVPAGDEFVVEVNHSAKQLMVDLPQGLLEL